LTYHAESFLNKKIIAIEAKANNVKNISHIIKKSIKYNTHETTNI
jgi:hypothetical protein